MIERFPLAPRSRRRGLRLLAIAFALLPPTAARSVVVCTHDGVSRCGAALADTTVGKSASLSGYSCAGAAAADQEEAIYRFLPQATGTVTFRLSGLTTDHDLYVLDSSADPAACVEASATGGTADEEVTFAATAGETYYVVVEAFGGATGTFELDSDTAAGTACEEDCGNGVDDDGDGDTDCDDVACSGDYACGTVFLDDLESGDFDAWTCRQTGS